MPAHKRARRRKRKEDEPRASLKEKVTEVLELPKEVVLNMPKLTMIGNSNLMIENYKGIIEYEDSRIRVNTAGGMIKILGNRLTIKEITSEDIMIDGEIGSLEFLK